MSIYEAKEKNKQNTVSIRSNNADAQRCIVQATTYNANMVRLMGESLTTL